VFFHESPEAVPQRRLSDELHFLAERFAERTVTLGEVMSVLGPRASGLLIILLALPFCAPVSIPGLSIPFGIVILVIAGRYALGLPPWLSQRLTNTRLPPKFFRAALEGASKLIGWIEKRLRPRWLWLTATVPRLRVHSLLIGFSAFLLLLPLVGMPFTNTLPALVIVVAMLGMMERDGIAIVFSYFLLGVTVTYLATFTKVLLEVFDRFKAWAA
jgi:hypothetical protein